MNAQPPRQPPPPPPPLYGRPPGPPLRHRRPADRAEEGRAYRFWGAEPGGSEWQAWTWTSRARPVPWFGALLLALGIGLLVEQLVPELSFWSLVILALGGAFAVAWLVGRVVGATVPALVLIGWGLARIGSELGYLTGDGWALLFVGIALLLAWALRARPARATRLGPRARGDRRAHRARGRGGQPAVLVRRRGHHPDRASSAPGSGSSGGAGSRRPDRPLRRPCSDPRGRAPRG